MRNQVLNEQSNDFPMAEYDIPGFGTVLRRLLSVDEQSGSETSRMVFPRGFRAQRSYFSNDLEMLVLRGRIEIGVHSMRALTYAYVPAGIVSGPWSVTEETEVLWMPSGFLSATISDDHIASARHLDYIPAMDFDATPWRSTITPGYYPGSMRKFLRTDSRDESQSWMLGTLPGQHDDRMEVHPVCEEAYIIQTSDPSQADVGVYLFRSPHIYHGPFHSTHGSLIFFRTHGGPLLTHYITPRGKSEDFWTAPGGV